MSVYCLLLVERRLQILCPVCLTCGFLNGSSSSCNHFSGSGLLVGVRPRLLRCRRYRCRKCRSHLFLRLFFRVIEAGDGEGIAHDPGVITSFVTRATPGYKVCCRLMGEGVTFHTVSGHDHRGEVDHLEARAYRAKTYGAGVFYAPRLGSASSSRGSGWLPDVARADPCTGLNR